MLYGEGCWIWAVYLNAKSLGAHTSKTCEGRYFHEREWIFNFWEGEKKVCEMIETELYKLIDPTMAARPVTANIKQGHFSICSSRCRLEKHRFLVTASRAGSSRAWLWHWKGIWVTFQHRLRPNTMKTYQSGISTKISQHHGLFTIVGKMVVWSEKLLERMEQSNRSKYKAMVKYIRRGMHNFVSVNAVVISILFEVTVAASK